MRLFACVASFILLVSVPLKAEPTDPKFVLAEWFPSSWVQDGQMQGFLVDVVAAVDQSLGTESNVALLSVPRIIRAIRSHEYDYTIAYRYDRQNQLPNYLVDVGCVRTVIMSLKSRPVHMLEDLNGMRVAFTNSAYFDQNFAGYYTFDDIVVPETDTMFRMLLRGRIDAFVVNDLAVASFRKGLHPKYEVPAGRWGDIADAVYVDQVPFAIMASDRAASLPLSDRLRALALDPAFHDRLQKIFAKYGLPDATQCLARPVSAAKGAGPSGPGN